MPQQPFLTSAGWSLNGLVMKGPRFHKVPRVSISDENLHAIICKHETSGVPLVIEGMREHRAWPSSMFDIEWIRRNVKQHVQVRNVHDRRDLDVSFEDFMSHIGSISNYASADETSRWYAKDVECPHGWKKWLDTTTLIPRSLCPYGPADIMQNLPELARVETLMCYFGLGDTFTPCHKDLCASFGHNLMCYADNGASAFWFMTESSASLPMAKYFQSLGQELDLESHAMSVEEYAAAPCLVYITEQKVGDLVLVPPRSCHQVVNHGGLTAKLSWSRMTIKSAQVALHHELPIYRRVCRTETYRIKSTIHHTLRRKTALLEDLAKGKESSASYHDVFQKHLADDVQMLLGLFQEIIRDEYHPNAGSLVHVVQDFNHNVYDSEGYPLFNCDFCGSDIFVSFFCCEGCSLSAKNSPSSGVSDGLHICPGCYAEGRSCRCERPMDPVQCWPLQILYSDYNRAVQALTRVGVDRFDEIDVQKIVDDSGTGIFEAATTVQKWRREVFIANKRVSQCYGRAQPHVAHAANVLPCKKCHKSRCFIHLAESGIHSSEAMILYTKSLDHGSWHMIHTKAPIPDGEAILASCDDSSNQMGQKLAYAALSFQHCQPLNIPYIKLGWYDRLKPNRTLAASGLSGAMDMSLPRDSNGWGDGSPLTEISPEDSVSYTLARSGTPPRVDGDRSGLSVSPTPNASITSESMKRKRSALAPDGVAPPGRKRKRSAMPSKSPRSASPPTSVNHDEKTRRSDSTTVVAATSTLETSLIQATSRIEALAILVADQNWKIEKLGRDNELLRDDIKKLSQTSKRDLQMFEITINKITCELRTKFEKMLDKSHSRIEEPIDRLLEELGRMHANLPPPVHVSGVSTFPSNTPFAAEPVEEENGGWGPREDYTPAGFNKQHYEEGYEYHGQPSNHYSRGFFRRGCGRGRGRRGGYSGNRPLFTSSVPPTHPSPQEGTFAQMPPLPSTPTTSLALAPTPAQAPAPVSAQVSAPTHTLWRDDGSYHSRGHAPPSQYPHSQSHTRSYTHQTHPYSRGRAQTDRRLTSPPPAHERYRHPRPQPYDRDRKRPPSPPPRFGDWDRPLSSLPPPPPPPPPREHFGDRDRPPSSFSSPHLNDRQRPPSPFSPHDHVINRERRSPSPPPPREPPYTTKHAPPPPPQLQHFSSSRDYAPPEYNNNKDDNRNDERHHHHHHSSQQQQQQQLPLPTLETTDEVGHRRHADSSVRNEDQQGQWTPSDNVGQHVGQTPSLSPGRGFTRRGPAEDARGGRR